jgi:predicted ATPase with chaperone activity
LRTNGGGGTLAKVFSCAIFGLEVMRQPTEARVVPIGRAQGTLTFSANFGLVVAMNPCPCGLQIRH